jgi:hypothetical protein
MILTKNDFLRETFFKKDAVALFGPFKSPDLPRYLYFF